MKKQSELQHEVVEQIWGWQITNPNGDVVMISDDPSAFALNRAYRIASYLDANEGDIVSALNVK